MELKIDIDEKLHDWLEFRALYAQRDIEGLIKYILTDKMDEDIRNDFYSHKGES